MIIIKYPSHVAILDDLKEIRKRANKLTNKFSVYAESPTRENAFETIKNTLEVLDKAEEFSAKIEYSDLIRRELREMYRNISGKDSYNTQEYLISAIQFCEYLCRAIANGGEPRKKVL